MLFRSLRRAYEDPNFDTKPLEGIAPFPHKESKIQETVFHGSTEQIEFFDKEKLGTSTKAVSAKMGFFFTTDKDTADSYAQLALKNLRVTKEDNARLAELDNIQWGLKGKEQRNLTPEESLEYQKILGKASEGVPKDTEGKFDFSNYIGSYKILDRKSTRLNSSHSQQSRMPSSA